MISPYLIMPFCSAIIYAVASVLLKRALKEGATSEQTFHFTNFAISLVFLPFFCFEKGAIQWANLWQPILVSFMFFLGNLTTFLAIKKGDVSTVTPLMGTKVVFVAVVMMLITKQMPTPALWGAAILTSVGIFLMGFSEFRKKTGSVGLSAILIILASALFFALQDVLLAHWSTNFGALTFMSLSMACLSGWSLLMWICQGRPSLKMPRASLKFSLVGGWFIGIQAALLGLALSFYHDATKINVIFATRGLWVLVVVAFLGGFFGNDEKKTAGKAFRWRIIGAILVTIAVMMVIFDKNT
jgi:drug/metabolite transporter (DMT)-like permease